MHSSRAIHLRLTRHSSEDASLAAVSQELSALKGWSAAQLSERLSTPTSLHAIEADATRDSPNALIHLYLLLQKLASNQLLEISIGRSPTLVVFTPIAPDFLLTFPAIDPDARFRLSRFAYMRRDDNEGLLLDTPCGYGRIALNDTRAVSTLLPLASGTTCRALTHVLGSESTTLALFQVLLMGKLIAPADRADEEDTALTQWEFHDLLFHARSRLGRHGAAIGGTFRFRGSIPPEPPLKHNAWRRHSIPLYRPELASIMAMDPPLAAVVERRHSIRQHGYPPISAVQLGEFLYRVGRVRSITRSDVGEFTSRPYPSGGASYELELYVTVDACVGLARGFYYYDPVDHSLCLARTPNQDVELLLHEAWVASAQQLRPQVLITIASRFQRVSWKYAGIAYATQLKNAGVLYAMMYLAATAMNLAPCALGLGNAERFCRLAGTSYYSEGSIAEFALGSRVLS